MTADLHVKQAGEGPAVVLLHGLFGSGSNLGAVARALQVTYTVYSVDLPNHGRSGWLQAPELPAMADTVQRWMGGAGLARAHFVGHSLGGKVAMELALRAPRRVASLTVADIAPVAYSSRHDAIFAALEAVAASPCTSRGEALARMGEYLSEDSVVQFLLSSLQRDGQGEYQWRFDVAGLKASLPSLLAAPAVGRVYTGAVLFVKGGASDYLQKQYWSAIQSFFPAATMKIMPGCGHWLHAEKPQLFNAIVSRFLASVEQAGVDGADGMNREG